MEINKTDLYYEVSNSEHITYENKLLRQMIKELREANDLLQIELELSKKLIEKLNNGIE